jgi:hypothetical protein
MLIFGKKCAGMMRETDEKLTWRMVMMNPKGWLRNHDGGSFGFWWERATWSG